MMQRSNASAIIRLCGPTIHRQLLSVISVESFVLRRKCWSWGDRRSIFSNVSSHTLQPRHKAAFCSVQFKALRLCFLCFLASGLSQISTCSDEARLIFFGQWTLKWTSCNLFLSLVCCRCWGEAWNLLVQLDLWAKRSCNLRFVPSTWFSSLILLSQEKTQLLGSMQIINIQILWKHHHGFSCRWLLQWMLWFVQHMLETLCQKVRTTGDRGPLLTPFLLVTSSTAIIQDS